jgi:hypothetical protein
VQIQLQRITGAFVSSAFGAAQFYGTKISAAKDLNSKLFNDDRDEDREGHSGLESQAERARLFAAEMILQSFSLMAAAGGLSQPTPTSPVTIGSPAWHQCTRRQCAAQIRRHRDVRLRDGLTDHGGGAARFRLSLEGAPLDHARASRGSVRGDLSQGERKNMKQPGPSPLPPHQGPEASGPHSCGLLDLCRLVTNGCAVCGGGKRSEKRRKNSTTSDTIAT